MTSIRAIYQIILHFDINNVSAIRILSTANDGTGTGGWWPNIDNITFNEPAQSVPEPSAMLGTLLASILGVAIKKKASA